MLYWEKVPYVSLADSFVCFVMNGIIYTEKNI